VRDGDEECEGYDLAGQSCASLQLGTGTLACSDDCTFDKSGCSANAACGNGIREGSEQCDGMDLDDKTCALLNLGTGTLTCTSNCTFDTAGCSQAADCGDGVVQGGEQCDGANLAGNTCLSVGEGFQGGTLACATDCRFDTSGCTGQSECGNGIIESGEVCDGSNFGGATCVSLGYQGGQLQCTSACVLDESGCTDEAEICDDGVDNDGDSFVDCDDADCYSSPACGGTSEVCNDGVDNDNDGYTDCDDADCSQDTACQGSNDEICDNGTDDDGNFLCDCVDIFACFMECMLVPGEETDCTDGLDDDQDCLVDCDDSDCSSDPACGGTPEVCDNGTDDDGDGNTDCDDADCVGDSSCLCYPLQTVSCGDQVNETTASGTNQIENYGCSGAFTDTGPEAYFLFSTSTLKSVTATMESGANDLDLIVIGETAGACDPDGYCVYASQNSGGSEEAVFDASGGTNYYLVVDGYSGAEGDFTLTISCQ
jgi:hypothetical protein